MFNTALILSDLSHPTFVTVVIVQSYRAFELVKSKFHFIFITQQTSKNDVLLKCPKSFYQITHRYGLASSLSRR